MNLFKRALRKAGRYPVSLALINLATSNRGLLIKCGGKWPLRVLWRRALVLDFKNWEKDFVAAYGQAISAGDVVFDVGAENGEWAAIAGTRTGGGNVYLFEPNNGAWQNVKDLWTINQLAPPGGFWEGFVSDKSAATTSVATKGGTWPAWQGKQVAFESLKQTRDIPAITIDDYVTSTGVVPSIIKMDIEGAEGLALKGAEATLREHKPIVFLSLHPPLLGDFGTDAAAVLGQFVSLGYESKRISVDHEEHWVFWHPAGRRPAL